MNGFGTARDEVQQSGYLFPAHCGKFQRKLRHVQFSEVARNDRLRNPGSANNPVPPLRIHLALKDGATRSVNHGVVSACLSSAFPYQFPPAHESPSTAPPEPSEPSLPPRFPSFLHARPILKSPICAILASASVNDSQVAIPLMTMTSARVTYLYELMDSAYDADEILAPSPPCQHD